MVCVRFEQSAISFLFLPGRSIDISQNHRTNSVNTDVINDMAIPRDHALPITLTPVHNHLFNGPEADDPTWENLPDS
jgi:hypothetical protein